MPKFTPKRFEQILAQMVAQVVTRTALSDVSDASVVKHILAAAARSDDEQYFQMQNLLTLFSIDTAVGDDLDERAKDIQPAVTTRIQARVATGVVVLSREGVAGTVAFSAGQKVKTPDGVIFTTTVDGEINPASPERVAGHGVGRDSAPVAAVADIPGADGNVAAETIQKFEGGKPPGINEVINLSTFSNGLDKESDDSFRQRLKDFVASLARCNVSAIEAGLVGQQDPDTNALILFANVFEDPVLRGNITVFIDDGTGSAEAVDQARGTTLVPDFTWNGTTTVAATGGDTSGLTIGDFSGLRTDEQLFEVTGITPGVDFTIANPGVLVIPSGSGLNQTFINPENVTLGLTGPPPDSAVGGETRLFLDIFPLKNSIPFRIVSSLRGILTQGVGNEVLVNPASGQLDFDPALVVSERVFAEYDFFTGLVAFAQKIVDGDANDRVNFPGLRAAGVFAQVRVPQVLIQNVDLTLTVKEGFDQDGVTADVKQAVKDYINTLNISGDVIISELIKRVMNTGSLANVIVNLPTTDVIILDDQLARTQDGNIVIT